MTIGRPVFTHANQRMRHASASAAATLRGGDYADSDEQPRERTRI